MVDRDQLLPENDIFELRATPGAGRGLFARRDLKAGTQILSTSTNFSPIAHVILRQYRREVCAFCFAYDRGKEWKDRIPQTGLSFCSTECIDTWKTRTTIDQLDALKLVEASIQRQQRQNYLPDRMEVDSEKPMTWTTAQQIGNEIIQARSRGSRCKSDRKLLATHLNTHVDPEITNFLLAGCFMNQSGNAQVASLLVLTDNPSVYYTASLSEHVRAYLHLAALLPESLLPHLKTDISHELISRASHNAFSIRPPSSSDGEQSGEFLGYGVWPEASIFNHSCEPNVLKERSGRLWVFRASRDVMKGEELCITYLGGDERDFDVQGRRKRLHDEWGFICQCRKCREEAI
jgi:hypothetical protein